ncbi:MAG TPA: ABC-F family ATP-binding cassette domain-containing protein [Polyangiaceae bacterium]
MPALTAQHLRKSFGVQVVLEDASVTIVRGEKVALIGANGAGKSTLAKILAGAETADGGTVSVRRGLSVRYLAQEPELDPATSARDAVVGAIVHDPADVADERDRTHEALGLLDQLGVLDVDRPCGERSGGERRRIAIARLLVARPDVAILDEPTNHLDADTAEWLEDRLANDFPGAVVLVTHDRYFLDAIAGRIVEIERGRLTSYPGGYGAYLDKKAELLAHEGRVEQNRQNILRREREWLSRGPKARSTKQKARIQRANTLEAQGAATAGRPGQVELVASAAAREGKTIVELKALALAPSPGARPLNAPFDLIVSAGDRIGVVGPNGVGKTTLVRALLGEPCVAAGEIVVGKNTRVAYLDQARAKLDGEKSIFDDVRGEGGGTTVHLGVRGMETMELRSYLELFLFDGAKQRQKVASLSGGERARVALAKVLREGANLLLFDEPTNDLDLATLGALEEMLVGFGGSVVVVTHDRAFLDGVATSILAFERDPGGGPAKVTRYAGGWQDYVAQRARAAAPARDAHAPPPGAEKAPAKDAPRAKPKGGLTYAERLELEGILEKVEAAEKRVTEVEGKLADPELYAKRGSEVASLQAELAAAKREAAKLVARWEELEQKKA